FDGGRNIFVFTRDQAMALFDYRDFAAKAAEHLPKLQADITSSNNNQMPRQKVDVHHRTVGEIRNLLDARQVGYHGSRAHIDENPLSREPGAADADFPSRFEASAPFVHGAVAQALEPTLDGGSRLP